ncbi:Plasmid maintenance system killer [Rhodospirillaceae bacterium LM-1]|nr:Plasmid maintenance system killer [Rhodospirillaceae bacterium LM-1]
MIKSFRHKGLQEQFENGETRRIDIRWQPKCLKILDMLNWATCPEDLEKSFGFHSLKGERSGSNAMSVTANWRITFRFDGQDVIDIDLEDYH